MLRFTKQLQCPSVTAFSLTSLFLERIWRKYKISLRSQKPVSKTKPSIKEWYFIPLSHLPRVMGPWYEQLDENYAVILLDF